MAAMQTNIHEIADGRLPPLDARPGGRPRRLHLQPVPDRSATSRCSSTPGPGSCSRWCPRRSSKVIDVERLRWISFGHVESDESGAMNQWLAAAPDSEVRLQRRSGAWCRSNDLCDRPPVVADPEAARDIGGHVVRTIPTPHVPHGWEAQVLFDETTRTLFCGDLFTQVGDGPALVHDADLIQPALDAEDMFGATALTATTAPTIRPLAELEPRTLALMHGPAYAGRRPPGAARPRRRLRGPVRRLARSGTLGSELMRQELTTDTVERYIEATPEALYDLISDVTRTPERTPDIAQVRVDRRRHRPGRRRPLQVGQPAGPRPEVEQQAGRHRRRPRPGVLLHPHRAVRRHDPLAPPVRARGHRHPHDRELRGDQADHDRRLVHHRHALRHEGPPGRAAGQHGASLERVAELVEPAADARPQASA